MDGNLRKYFGRLTGGMAATAAFALLVVAAPASADTVDEVPVGTRLAARTHPAVQLTSITYSGEVVVPSSQAKEAAWDQLTNEATRAVLTGKIPSDERSIAKFLFQRVAADVDRYLRPVGPERTVKAQVGGMCTGWWVTPDGYMVTGAHCVEMSDEELSQTFARQALEKFNKQDAKDMINALRNFEADKEMIELVQQIYVTFNSTHLEIRGLRKSLSVLQSLPGGGVDKTAKEVPAELVSVGESYPGKDFALLKVNGRQNLPTVPLGDDADVQTGDTLYISGFPGLVTNTPWFSVESKLDPALTEGPYNAKRTTQEGVPYVQTQAPSYHGNSGGPVFSRAGKVVGMLIAGTVSENGEASENESFVLPVSIIKEKLNEKNVRPAASLTTTKYNEALDDFFQRHYKDALPKFREVQALFPSHPYVAKYITDSQQAISSGKDETPQPLWLWIAAGAGALVVAGGGLLLLILMRRRRKTAFSAQGQSPSPAYGGPYFQADGGGGYPAQVGAGYDRQPVNGHLLPQGRQPQSLPPANGHRPGRTSGDHEVPPSRDFDPQRPGVRYDRQRPDMGDDSQRPDAGNDLQRLDGATRYVRPAPSPYGQQWSQAAPGQGQDQVQSQVQSQGQVQGQGQAGSGAPDIADLEREIAELRRQLQHRQLQHPQVQNRQPEA
ncbi:serine protease [Microbispora hainanensis]|uniref:Serine protease n=1 Tax=Microbispora hainanensis TaxID=568844 RepID=A0ABZ1T2B7_9ACTN|nr:MULTISPECIES: serine protease [Microbispora]